MTLNRDAKFEYLDLVVSKMAWGLGELSLEHSKVWKIVLWWAFFVQTIQCCSYKISEELYVMTLKGNAKFKGKLTFGF